MVANLTYDPMVSDVTKIETDGIIQDLRVTVDAKTKHLWGRFGKNKELELAAGYKEQHITVLLGSGLGFAVEELIKKSGSALIIIDREKHILAATEIKKKYHDRENLYWIDDDAPKEAAAKISDIAEKYGQPLNFLKIPFYLRLNPQYYCGIEKYFSTAAQGGNSGAGFKSTQPRILLLTSQYFLMGEIEAACTRLEIPFQMINLDSRESELEHFVKTIVKAISGFRPDFVLTVNHLGVDQEGYLNTILQKYKIPLASWFVDNPHLILPLYARQVNNNTALFTWDSDRMESLSAMGYQNIFHLPLGTDQNRFKPSGGCTNNKWQTDISFVGNSMTAKTARRFSASKVTGILRKDFKEIAAQFGANDDFSVEKFLKERYPQHFMEFEKITSPAKRLAYETAVIWQATLEYRLSCIKKISPFNPLIAGDEGWKDLLPSTNWKYHPELSYYEDLPNFYPCSKINFNCTSQQMKGAVNQRVFDVPACNGFLLTDHRHQISTMFDPDKEIVLYRTNEEIPELVQKYLTDDKARKKVITAARKRIMAEHTYDHRMTKLTEIMRSTFA
jgi:spore maturation protein CgeB